MTTTETTTITTLEPQQFIVARALAQAYGHLWAGVPDGTYNLDDIESYSDEKQSDSLPIGIYSPTVSYEYGQKVVKHTTGSNRLEWEVYENGNVLLRIHRPDGQVLYATMAKDDQEFFSMESDFSFSAGFPELDDENFIHSQYDADLNANFSGRHVAALMRPLVALLMIGKDYEHLETDTHEDCYNKYHAVLNPVIEEVKVYLKPLFDLALPDPIVAMKGDVAKDATYWTKDEYPYDDTFDLAVHHNNESFPVESERTAIHAVLLLRTAPDIPLTEAIKASITSKRYRPVTECIRCGVEIKPNIYDKCTHCMEREKEKEQG